MSRQQIALPVPSPEGVARVPDVALPPLEVARATWRRLPGMWWFSNRSDDPGAAGRYDLRRPRGTCYFATEPITALIEKLTDPDDIAALVDPADVAALDVWIGHLSRPEAVADTTRREARLPKELGTITPYGRCWDWADAFEAAGRGGLLAWARLDPGPGRTIAVFGPASDRSQPPDPEQWPLLADTRSGADYLDELEASVDIIEDPPTADQLTFVADPGDGS